MSKSYLKNDTFLSITADKKGYIQKLAIWLNNYIVSKNTIMVLSDLKEHCLYIENINDTIYIFNEKLRKNSAYLFSPIIINRVNGKIVIRFSSRNAIDFNFVEEVDDEKLGLLEKDSLKIIPKKDSVGKKIREYFVYLLFYDELIPFIDALYPQ